MAKTKTEIHVTTVFDGELDAADVFVSLIAQKYGQNTGKENLVISQDLSLPVFCPYFWAIRLTKTSAASSSPSKTVVT